MTNKIKFGALIGAVTVSFFLATCMTSRNAAPPPQMIIPNYDFTPASTAGAGSAKMKIALFNPSYSGTFKYSNKSPFKQFRTSMSKDLEEVLSARGYIIKGPFDAYDFMTYSDKQECELGLFVDIDLDLEQIAGGWQVVPATPRRGFAPATAGYQSYSGTLNLSGKISIYVGETFTKQKLLIKSVPLPQSDFQVRADKTYELGTTGIPLDNTGVHNPISNALLDFYRTTMQQAWNLIETSELAHVNAQVPEIRKGAGFIKN